jgi:predicted lipoprotein with Yx(FWY)xxD motif
MHWLTSRLVPSLFSVSLLLATLIALQESPARAQDHARAPAMALVKMGAAHILVTSRGRTLYVFARDTKNRSVCKSTCATVWPPLVVPRGATPSSKVSGVPGAFGETTRTGGTKQLTYDGAPLYTYSGDRKAGDIHGVGLNINGGYWWAVVTSGK